MDPIESWVDPEQVRRLAEALMTPVARTRPASEEAAYSQQFVGFAESQQTASATPTAGLGTISQQLKRFRETIPSHVSCKGFFALNGEAQVICDDGDHQHLHFVARDWIKAGLASAHQHVQLRAGSTEFLELISVRTKNDLFILAFIVHSPLSSTALAQLTNSLLAHLTVSSS